MSTTPSYQVASWALRTIDNIFKLLGIPRNGDLEEIVYTIIVICIALSIGWIVKLMALFIIKRLKRLRNSESMSALQGQHVFIKGSSIIPPLVFIILIPFAFTSDAHVLHIILKTTWIYFIYTIIRVSNAILSYLWHRYDERDNNENHPLKGLLQVSKGIVWLIGFILIGSLLLGKSPVVLLTGLGAFAAILMLVFKDSILGMVAGVQLSQNDMLRVGDWIVVPDTPANGIVIDVTLTVVKVQNWDNTIAMLPPYTLVSTSFQNWRGMAESGARRIARAYMVDIDSIQFSTPEMLEDFKKIDFMNDYIEIKQKQATEGIDDNTNNPANIVNGTIDTNLGLLRAYMTMYLKNKKNISQSSTLMVRTLDPTTSGVPLQLYCFTNTTDWLSYESIQSEIFEHFASILPRFGLYAFENPSGRDTVNQGFLEGGIMPNQVYGLPHQSIYNWNPGENKYTNPEAYKYWDTPLPQNKSYDPPPRNTTTNA
ncbi:MAG: mechanosensitive ion channel [Muribaculaceae bacterium]